MAAPKVDILVNLLTALQPDPSTTTLPLNDADQPLDYSRLIGEKVISHDTSIAQLISNVNSLYSTVTGLNTSVSNLYSAVDPVPDFAFPGIMGDNLIHSIEDITLAIGNQFLDLKNGTGDSSNLLDAVTYQPSGLASEPPLYEAYSTMADIPNWVNTPANIADTIKNIWLTINDMRQAVSNYISVRGVSSCSAVTVSYTAVPDVINKRLILFFVGNCDIPSGFVDVNSVGGSLLITDGSSAPNTYTVNVNVSEANKNTNGVIIDLASTSINLYTNLRLDLTYSLTNNDLVCNGTSSATISALANPCVQGSLQALSSSSITGTYFIQPTGYSINYRIETFTNAGCTTAVAGSQQTFSNPTTNIITYTISGLSSATTYYVRMSTQVGGLSYVNCTAQSITTL